MKIAAAVLALSLATIATADDAADWAAVRAWNAAHRGAPAAEASASALEPAPAPPVRVLLPRAGESHGTHPNLLTVGGSHTVITSAVGASVGAVLGGSSGAAAEHQAATPGPRLGRVSAEFQRRSARQSAVAAVNGQRLAAGN